MSDSVVSTRYWHRLDDGRVQCDVCPRHCRLREGQQGLCYVRMRQDGEVKLVSYGRSSGFCADPIEKKPLDHFLPGSAVLSFGTAMDAANVGLKAFTNRFYRDAPHSRRERLERRARRRRPVRTMRHRVRPIIEWRPVQ
jgi:hypothetical protein